VEARLETRKGEGMDGSGNRTTTMTVEESMHASTYEKTTSETVIGKSKKKQPLDYKKDKVINTINIFIGTICTKVSL
jgi:hypothetical protein